MANGDSDIKVRIAGDLADIRRSMDELRRQTRGSGTDAKAAGRDWSAFNRQLTGIRNSIRSIVGAYLSFRAVSSLARGIIRNTAEQQRVQAQLAAAIESTGSAAGVTAEELTEMAAAFQRVTTFGDEEILSAQSQLLTFTNITRETFEQATEAVLNLSTRMGTDLRSAVVQIGKALNDPILGVTALAKAGIQFTDQQRAMIRSLVESGDLLGAQRMILAELETQFGGSARAARDTFGGALKAVQNAAGDLLEAEGGGITDLTGKLNELAELLASPAIKDGMQTLASGLAQLAQWGIRAAVGIANFGDQLGALIAQLTGQLSDEDSIEQWIKGIDRALSGNILTTPIALLGKTREELEALRAAYVAMLETGGGPARGRIQRPGQAPAAPTPPGTPPPGETAEERAAREAREAAARAAAEAAAQAEAELQARLEGIRRRLLVAQGQSSEARRLALQDEFADLLAELDAKGDEAGAALVRKLINVELAKTRLDELRAEFDRVTADMGRQEQSIQALVETGAISESEGRRRINALYEQTAERLRQLLPLMQELAEVSGDPVALDRVEEMRSRIEELARTATDTGQRIGEAFRDAGESATANWLQNIDDLKGAFKGFLDDLKARLADIIAQQLWSPGGPLGGILGFFSHGGGMAGRGSRRAVNPLVFAGAPRLHRGGLASDEVPAILQRGEEVLTRSDPRHVLNAGLAGGNRTEINVSGTSDPALVITAAVQAADIIERRQARRRR